MKTSMAVELNCLVSEYFGEKIWSYEEVGPYLQLNYADHCPVVDVPGLPSLVHPRPTWRIL